MKRKNNNNLYFIIAVVLMVIIAGVSIFKLNTRSLSGALTKTYNVSGIVTSSNNKKELSGIGVYCKFVNYYNASDVKATQRGTTSNGGYNLSFQIWKNQPYKLICDFSGSSMGYENYNFDSGDRYKYGVKDDGFGYNAVLTPKGLKIDVIGSVYDNATGLGLAGAKVKCENSTLKYQNTYSALPEITTDSKGKFKIANIMVDNPAQASEYLITSCTGTSGGSKAITKTGIRVAVKHNQADNISYDIGIFSLPRDLGALAISGKVISAQDPFAGISGVLVDCDLKTTSGYTYGRSRSATTDSDGKYTINYSDVPKNSDLQYSCNATPSGFNYYISPDLIYKLTSNSEEVKVNLTSVPKKIKVRLVGRVYENYSNTVINGASVTCNGMFKTTDPSGQFAFENIEIDNKTSEQTMACTISESKYLTIYPAYKYQININQANSKSYYQEFWMNKSGSAFSLSGSVVSAQSPNKGIKNSSVFCKLYYTDPFNKELKTVSKSVAVDTDSGFFSIYYDGLPKITYFQYDCPTVTHTDYDPASVAKKDFIVTTSTTVSLGQIKLSPRSIYMNIKGKVVDANTNSVIKGATVKCEKTNTNEWAPSTPAVSDNNGIFNVSVPNVKNTNHFESITCLVSASGYKTLNSTMTWEVQKDQVESKVNEYTYKLLK